MLIREATDADIPRLIEMGRRFQGATSYDASVTENGASLAALCVRLIESDAGLLLVADADGLPVGMIGAFLFPHHFSGRLTVGEVFFWVEPEHRGCGVRLLRRAERWAQERGALQIQMIRPQDAVSVGTLYERLGYRPLEVAYAKELV